MHDGVDLNTVLVDAGEDGSIGIFVQYNTDEDTEEVIACLDSLSDDGWDVDAEEGSEGMSSFVDARLEGHGWNVSDMEPPQRSLTDRAARGSPTRALHLQQGAGAGSRRPQQGPRPPPQPATARSPQHRSPAHRPSRVPVLRSAPPRTGRGDRGVP